MVGGAGRGLKLAELLNGNNPFNERKISKSNSVWLMGSRGRGTTLMRPGHIIKQSATVKPILRNCTYSEVEKTTTCFGPAEGVSVIIPGPKNEEFTPELLVVDNLLNPDTYNTVQSESSKNESSAETLEPGFCKLGLSDTSGQETSDLGFPNPISKESNNPCGLDVSDVSDFSVIESVSNVKEEKIDDICNASVEGGINMVENTDFLLNGDNDKQTNTIYLTNEADVLGGSTKPMVDIGNESDNEKSLFLAEESVGNKEVAVSDLMSELMGPLTLYSSCGSDVSGLVQVHEDENLRIVGVSSDKQDNKVKAEATQRSKDEQWRIYQVEREINDSMRNLTRANLGKVSQQLRTLIEDQSLVLNVLDFSVVELLIQAIIENVVQLPDLMPLAPALIKMISEHQPEEFKQYFLLICDAKCKEYITLSSSEDYLNNIGRNFCKFIGRLYTLPQMECSTLFKIVSILVSKYVKQWSCMDEQGVHEQELAVSASALNCLLLEIAHRRSNDDMEVQAGLEKFSSFIRNSVLNVKVPRLVREIYLNGLISIQVQLHRDNKWVNLGSLPMHEEENDSHKKDPDQEMHVEGTKSVFDTNIQPTKPGGCSNGVSMKLDAISEENELGSAFFKTGLTEESGAADSSMEVSKPQKWKRNNVQGVAIVFSHKKRATVKEELTFEEKGRHRRTFEDKTSNLSDSGSEACNTDDSLSIHFRSSVNTSEINLPLGRGRGLAHLPDLTARNIPVASVSPIGYQSRWAAKNNQLMKHMKFGDAIGRGVSAFREPKRGPGGHKSIDGGRFYQHPHPCTWPDGHRFHGNVKTPYNTDLNINNNTYLKPSYFNNSPNKFSIAGGNHNHHHGGHNRRWRGKTKHRNSFKQNSSNRENNSYSAQDEMKGLAATKSNLNNSC